MRMSLTLTDYSWPGGPSALSGALSDVVRAADEAGLDTVWVPDHLVQADPSSTPDGEMLEAYTALGFIAARTRRVRVGTMVTAATFRPAALLIKAVTTLDVLSGGRAWLGIGAGYHEQEARAMGLPLPPAAERFDRLEDTVRLAHAMFEGSDAPFEGRRLRLERPLNHPRPVSRPHPPILIGGMGERRTLPLVARYADACNLFDIPDGGATLARKLEVLAALTERHGRRREEVEKTVSTRLAPGETAEHFAARCEVLARLGIEHAVVLATGPWTEDAIGVLADASARLA
jgi:F420-dependent oxidoreductase-like protein